MGAERIITIEIDPDLPMNALASLATRIIAELAGTDTDATESDRATRLTAEGADPEGLVAGLVDHLCAIGEEFEATPVSVSIDGFRTLTDGLRAWGVVGLSYDHPSASLTVRRLSTPVVTHADQGWQIRVAIAIT